MVKPTKTRTPEFKFKIAVEALKGADSIKDLAVQYNLHPRQITKWRDKLLLEGEDLFIHKATQRGTNPNPDKEELLHIIKKLHLELDFLKKKLG